MEFHPTAGSIRPGPPAVGDALGAMQRSAARATGQLQRQRVDDAVGGGGGPVGIVNIGSINGTITLNPSGSQIEWESVRYDAPQVVFGAGNWLTFDGPDIHLAPGLYHPVLMVYVRWATASAPNGVQAFLGGGNDWAHQGGTNVAPVLNFDGSQKAVEHTFDHGPTYVTSGGYLRAEVQFAPNAGALLAGAYHNWTITKLA